MLYLFLTLCIYYNLIPRPSGAGSGMAVSTDPQYKLNEILKFIKPNNCHDANPSNHFENYHIEPLLCKLKNTAPGCDNLPSWIFRQCSVDLADVVAKLLNLSFDSGNVYSNWKTAIVTSVPKVAKSTSVADFRPISVTPILSYIAERLVVKQWLYPAIPTAAIQDQFAYRPTGSTTCSLVSLLHHVTLMLKTNRYVRCLVIDFSKAFDVVNHEILLRKLSALHLPNNIYNLSLIHI